MVSSQTITLSGRILTDDQVPVPQTQISVSGGFEDYTDDDGEFNIKLSSEYIDGEQVILRVAKDNWVINHPLDGIWDLPNHKYQFVHTVDVVIVPHGSMALWTHERIEKHVAQLSDEITKQASLNEQKTIDFTRFLAKWAETYGFDTEQVKIAFDEWANEVKTSTDTQKKAWADFYQKNFIEAAQSFELAARKDEASLKQIEEAATKKRLAAYENWKNAGIALQLAYQFDSALTRFQKAATLVNRTDYPFQWAEIRMLTGNSKRELGIRVEGSKAIRLLQESILSYQEILREVTQAELPQLWALTQIYLGNALSDLGIQVNGQRSLNYLQQALTAYDVILEELVQTEEPQLCALTQSCRGATLRELGMRTTGQKAIDYLQQAIEVYEAALKEYTKSDFPQDWARTHNNLGNVLSHLGTLVRGQEALNYFPQAVKAFRYALEVRTQTELPQQWAMTQNNLGNVLNELGAIVGGKESLDYLKQAVVAYEAALEEFTQTDSPQMWAMIQNNLGNVLSRLGTRVVEKERLNYLRQAVEAYKVALEEYTQTEFPQQWARTHNNLGAVLIDIGTRVDSPLEPNYLQRAVTAFRYALEVRTRTEFPQDWAMTQNNLGRALLDIGIRVDGALKLDYIQQAITAFQYALEIRTQDVFPQWWGQTHNNLAEAYHAIRQYDSAAQSYSNGLKIYPYYQKAYNYVVNYHHEIAFNYPEAYAINKNWLLQFPNDLSAHSDFAEKYFTTARFSACAQQINALLSEPKLSINNQIVLRSILLANAFAIGQNEDEIKTQFRTLHDVIAQQKADLTIQKTFRGTTNFISQHEALVPYRTWLLAFFHALKQKDRASILADLAKLEKSLPMVTASSPR